MRVSAALVVLLGVSAPPQIADAVDITVRGKGSTFVVHFNAGYTQARADTIADATQIWADALSSSVDIEVDMSFANLSCTKTSATLGFAGTRNVVRDFANAPASNTWYPVALGNALAGTDLIASRSDIGAQFNALLDDPAAESTCLTGVDWHYGTGAAPSGTISFYDVVLHELAHGLGFQSFADFESGSLFSGRDDHYLIHLEDRSRALALGSATASDSDRKSAFVDDGDLVWTGGEVVSAASLLTQGVAGNKVQMYAPSSVRGGSSVSHFDTRLTPNELMEPFATASNRYALTAALFRDIGWPAPGTAPIIVSQAALAVDEDASLTLTLADLTVDDPDSSYPADFTLQVSGGANYTVAGARIEPDPDFSGAIYVPVSVNDGQLDSPTFTATVTVRPINDPPTVTAQTPLTIEEDGSLTLELTDLEIADPDSTSFSLTVSEGANYTRAGRTITPSPNFFGPLQVPVSVSDGDLSASFTVSVTVTPVNDPPRVVAGGPLTVPEDGALALRAADFTIEDPDSTAFTVRADEGTFFSVEGSNVIPAPDYAGPLSVSVRVSDGAAESAPFTLSVDVTPVNDPPVVVSATPLATPEDTPVTVDATHFTITDVDSAGPFTVTPEAGPDHAVTGSMVLPNLDFVGTLDVPVTVSDGSDASRASIAIEVTDVADPPRIVGQAILTVPEDETLVVTPADLTIEDPDSTTFTLSAESGDDFSVSPRGGGLDVTPAPDFNGPLTVHVFATDGALNSAPFALDVTVTPVDDAPSIVGQRVLTTEVDLPVAVSVDDLEIDDPDGDTSFALRLQPGANYTVDGATVTPAPLYRGPLTVPVTVFDGRLESAPFLLAIGVTVEMLPELEVRATGLLTPFPEVEPPESLGVLDGPVTVALVDPPPRLRAGRHTLLWQERSPTGESAQVEQTLVLTPVVHVAPPGRIPEGGAGTLTVYSHGPAVATTAYPLALTGTADLDDHTLRGPLFVEEGAWVGRLPFEVVADGDSELDETVEIAAAEGRATFAITEGNAAPRLTVDVAQGGREGLPVVVDGGPVTLSATALDPGDAAPRVTWERGGISEATGPEWTIDPRTWGAGLHVVHAVAEDERGGRAVRTVTISVVTDATAPRDTDLDGVADERDAWPLPHVVSLAPAGDPFEPLDPRLLEASPGTRVALAPDPDALRLLLTELPEAGSTVRFTWPRTGEGELAVTGWAEGTALPDTVRFARREAGVCPPPGDPKYGHAGDPSDVSPSDVSPSDGDRACVEVTLTDGGPSDPDGAADRELRVMLTWTNPPEPSAPAEDKDEDEGLTPSADPGDAPGAGLEFGAGCGCRTDGRASADAAAGWVMAMVLSALAYLQRRRPGRARIRRGFGSSRSARAAEARSGGRPFPGGRPRRRRPDCRRRYHRRTD